MPFLSPHVQALASIYSVCTLCPALLLNTPQQHPQHVTLKDGTEICFPSALKRELFFSSFSFLFLIHIHICINGVTYFRSRGCQLRHGNRDVQRAPLRQPQERRFVGMLVQADPRIRETSFHQMVSDVVHRRGRRRGQNARILLL